MDSLEKFRIEQRGNLSVWDDGSFSFANLRIHLKDTASQEVLIKEKEKARCYPTLIHEYIHYIQNFTTSSGFFNFISYIDLFAYFFSVNMGLPSDPNLPLKGGEADLSLGNKNLENFIKNVFLGISRDSNGKIMFIKVKKADFYMTEATIYNPYWQKNEFISYIVFKEDQVPINRLIIQENMAIIGTYLASGLGLSDCEDQIITWPVQYHIIYSFIKELFQTKDCLKLTYLICEISLMFPPHNNSISAILKFLKKNQIKLCLQSEQAIFEEIKEQVFLFKKAFPVILNGLREQLTSRIEMYKIHSSTNEFYPFVIKILENYIGGFEVREKELFSYRPKLDINFLNTYEKYIKSPILTFPDGRTTLYGDPNPEYTNALAYFSGVQDVMLLAYRNEIHICPFCKANSLCQLPKRAKCYANTSEIFGDPDYEGCLMYNALQIIGIKSQNRVSNTP